MDLHPAQRGTLVVVVSVPEVHQFVGDEEVRADQHAVVTISEGKNLDLPTAVVAVGVAAQGEPDAVGIAASASPAIIIPADQSASENRCAGRSTFFGPERNLQEIFSSRVHRGVGNLNVRVVYIRDNSL